MKFNFPINNFTAGEWSPKLKSRTDAEQYSKACETLKNFIVKNQAGASFRAGFRNAPIPNGTNQWNIINDILNLDETYANFYMIPYTPSNEIYSCIFLIANNGNAAGGTYYGFPENRYFVILPSVTGTSTVTEITETSPLGFASYWKFGIDYTQVGDLTVVVDRAGGSAPRVFYYDTATASYKFKQVEQSFISARPWETIPWGDIQALDSDITITPSATTGAITLTYSANPGIYSALYWPGTYVRLCLGTNLDGIVRIDSIAGALTRNATVLQTIPTAAIPYGATSQPTSFFQASAWFTGNFPRTVTSYQSRIIYGGSPRNPDTIWGSRTNDYFYMQEVPAPNTTGTGGFASNAYTADNSRAFTLTPNSAAASNIVALSSAKSLSIHTDKSEIVAYGSNGGFGPVNVVYDSSTSFGASRVRPIRVNNFLTFATKDGTKIRDIVFNFNEDQYKSSDLGFVAEHYFREGDSIDSIQDMCAVENDTSVMYVRTKLKKLYAVTLDRDYQITAWTQIPLGKSPADSSSYSKVFSIASFPVFDASDIIITSKDTLWVLVKRIHNGVAKMYLERKSFEYDRRNPNGSQASAGGMNSVKNLEKPFYLDFSKEVVEAGTTAVSSFAFGSDYANLTVSVVLDGNYLGEFTADGSGNITTTGYTGFSCVAGFKYQGIIKPMPLEQGGQIGVPMGRIKRIDECIIRFFNTAGPSIGPTETDQQDITYREPSQPANTGIDYFTGDKEVSFDGNYDRAVQPVIVQDKPYPCHVVGIIPRGMTNDQG